MHSVGAGAGLGHSINVPWNTTAERQTPGDAEYLYAFERVLLPVSPHDHGRLWLRAVGHRKRSCGQVAREFAPDLILVSAGFDAAAGDPLGGCNVTPFGYAAMTRALLSLPSAAGRCVWRIR